MSENDNEKIYLRNNISPSSCPLPPKKKSKCTLFAYFKDKTWV